jgi:DeoR/GlpR family transcriptional regulator of sugar metabolism
MTRTAKARRQDLILAELRINRTIRVSELAEKFGTSTETIRRDLDEMKAAELLNRTHGGATSLPMGHEPSLLEREHILLGERRRIAEKAVATLRPNDVVMMDSGTTTLEVAKAMSARLFSNTVITNSYPVASVLAVNPMLRVVMPPGEFTAAESMVNGAETNEFVRRFSANVFITGASGLTIDGPADTNLDASRLKRTMMSRAHKTMLVADHSKFDRSALETICPWDKITTVVTDVTPPDPFREAFEASGVELIVAEDAEVPVPVRA